AHPRALLRLRAQRGQIQRRRALEMIELADDLVAGDGLRISGCGKAGANEQDGGGERSEHALRSRPHQRYPASPIACWQRLLTPLAVVRHGIALEVSLVEPAHSLT